MEVYIYCNSKTMYCNCPDSKSWARDLNVYCKHSCFVLFSTQLISQDSLSFENIIILDTHAVESQGKTGTC